MTGRTDVLVPAHVATETSVPVADGTGWLLGDAARLRPRVLRRSRPTRAASCMATQPKMCWTPSTSDTDGPTRRKFLARLQGEITKRGVIDVLRHGIKHGPHHVDLFYGTPSPGNAKAAERYAPNRFSVTRQLRYSRDETQLALDLGAVHQRPAGRHLRAEEQPDQADRRGRRRAVQARPRPARDAVRVRPLRRPLRRRRPRGALLHAPEGQGVVVPAVQPGLERRRRQPAEPGRAQDRLPLEADPHAATA